METKGSSILTAVGLFAAAAISIAAFGLRGRGGSPGPEERHPTAHVVRLLAVGDINLGRFVGQEILAGDTLFPFAMVCDTFALYDVVFGNLESDISDQAGETEDPSNNLVFTAPPAAARSLALAGVTMVSTANNHALDYGVTAARETREELRRAGIPFAGTGSDAATLFDPAIVVRNGIRIALFACTDLMNVTDTVWRSLVAPTDTGRLFARVRSVRDSVDFIIISVHSGEEYSGRPTGRTIRFGREAVEAGADLVLGHHPHVPYGIERHDGRTIVYSLGNFVFSQPARYWTRFSYAFAGTIRKDGSGTRLEAYRCLPVRCGFQPSFLGVCPDADSMYERIHMQSMTYLAETRP